MPEQTPRSTITEPERGSEFTPHLTGDMVFTAGDVQRLIERQRQEREARTPVSVDEINETAAEEYKGRHEGVMVKHDDVDPEKMGRHSTPSDNLRAVQEKQEWYDAQSPLSRFRMAAGTVALRVLDAGKGLTSVSFRDSSENEEYEGRHRITREEARARRRGESIEPAGTSIIEDILSDDESEEGARVITIPVGYSAIEKIFARAGRLYGAAEQKLGLAVASATGNIGARLASSSETSTERQGFWTKKKAVAAVLGGLTVGVAGYIAAKNGMHFGTSGNSQAAASGAEGVLPPLGGEPTPVDQVQGVGFGESDYGTSFGSSGAQAPESGQLLEFSADARTISRGEGLFQTMKEMGIPKADWKAVLAEAGPELVKKGFAYKDSGIGGFGLKMTKNGTMPQEALEIIAKAQAKISR